MEKLNDSPRGEEEANQFLSSSLTRPLSEIVHVCVCVCVCVQGGLDSMRGSRVNQFQAISRQE